jgi:hypothetical protein
VTPVAVSEHREALALLHQTHGDAGHRRLDRHARVHQRQAGAADACHRARAVRLEHFGNDAKDIREGLEVRHDGHDAAPGQIAVADLAALGRAHEPSLAHRERREVVVQHERLAAFASQRVDDLRVTACAEGRRDERLRLAAGEYRRSVRARQRADLDADRADGLEVAAVDTRLAVQDQVADQAVLEVVQRRSDLLLRVLGLLATRERLLDLLADVGELRDARLLDDCRIRIGQTGLRLRGDRLLERNILVRRLPVPARLAGLGCELVDGVDGGLHLLVPEQHRAEHDFLGKTLGFRLHHQYRVLRARDHEVEVGLGANLAGRGIQEVLAALVADARRADRRRERNARQRDRRRSADQRRNVGIDLGVERKHRRDDLDFVVEALGEQRPQRPVDEAGSERLLLGGSPFALEEAARNLAGGVSLLDVVDGEREEVAAGDGFAAADGGDEHHRVSHPDDDRAVGLTGQAPGLDRDGVRAITESLPGNAQASPL